jgi:hypothetical protein
MHDFFMACFNFALAMWLAWRHEAASGVQVFFAVLVTQPHSISGTRPTRCRYGF